MKTPDKLQKDHVRKLFLLNTVVTAFGSFAFLTFLQQLWLGNFPMASLAFVPVAISLVVLRSAARKLNALIDAV